MTRPPFWLHAAVVLAYAILVTIGLHYYQYYVSSLGLFGNVVTSFILGAQGGVIWTVYWRRRAMRKLHADLLDAYLRSRQYMEQIAVEFIGDACPDCSSTLFNPGPRGGCAHNIRCAECGAKFWYSPPFTPLRLVDSDDRYYDLAQSRTLDTFTNR